MAVQFSLDEGELALLDDWKQYTNNNRTRLVEELIALADEATEATDEDDPREALRELLEEYPSYARDSGYDPDATDTHLNSEELRAMCLRDPVPSINPQHVIPPELRPMNTWTKAGIIAGILRYKYDDPLPEEVKKDKNKSVKDLIRRYCGGRSGVEPKDVLLRLDESVPELMKIDVDAGNWMDRVEQYLDEDDDFMIAAPDEKKRKFIENRIDEGEDVIRAMHEDGDDRLEEAREMKNRLIEEQSDLTLDAMSEAEPVDE